MACAYGPDQTPAATEEVMKTLDELEAIMRASPVLGFHVSFCKTSDSDDVQFIVAFNRTNRSSSSYIAPTLAEAIGGAIEQVRRNLQ
jgi:hypothetical protein